MYFKKKLILLIGILYLTSSTLIACGVKEKQPVSSQTSSVSDTAKVELTISAAASLTDSMKEIQTIFTKKYSHINVNYNFGASGTLQQQIEQGAPVDLFISAGTKQFQALADKKLIEKSRNLVTNELVMIAPVVGTSSINTIEDLSKSEVKYIAVGQPDSVPAGNYAKQSLMFYKLWDSLQSKVVLAKDVRQVLTYVETGNSDAGFVYKTDAISSSKVKVILTLDQKSYSPIQYPIGLIKSTKHPKESQLFFDFLQSKEANEIFLKFGFSLPSL
jgi:molybdate transport system substrate-binding protein